MHLELYIYINGEPLIQKGWAVSMEKTRESIMTEQITGDTGAILNPAEHKSGNGAGRTNSNGNGNYSDQNIQILEGHKPAPVPPGMCTTLTAHPTHTHLTLPSPL